MISGKVVRTERVSHPRMTPQTQIWLGGVEHPFRFDEIKGRALLLPGKVLEIGIESHELASPHYAAADRQHFYLPITARIVGGSPILHLESHNRRLREMRWWFPWLSFWLGVAGLLLSTRYAFEEMARQRTPKGRSGRDEPLKFSLLKP